MTYKDALDHCKGQNASLALVDSKPVQLALESLLISKNAGKTQPWKELVWTSVLTSVGKKCSTAPRLMDFRSLSKYTKDHKTYLKTTTQWLAVGSNEKHNFVCQKGWLIALHASSCFVFICNIEVVIQRAVAYSTAAVFLFGIEYIAYCRRDCMAVGISFLHC